ncbi:leucine-rich repeat-containing protein 61-like isoform X2 [Ostrea edulis]|uniref:leucine-rich repeat-containing protein 61-like isoform X2 n=1 Tax=Ostrea edulis TaxID=37623 RepID=UPI0024AF8389|nr:leucine-rich repeat-containing protein 61-like isoform X2 [Ostrea edulis]
MNDGRITKALLKTRSGEFDIESIHTLNLRDCGLSDLGCVSECTQLERLNLSRNDLTKLNKLAGLGNLAVLNLSGNRITNLEGLQALENLQSVNLAGNLIGSINGLRCLTALDKLEELRIHDSVKDLSNPLCHNSMYRRDVLDMLPNLKVLDGERILGHGSDVFSMCRDIEEALERRQDVNSQQHSTPSPWVSDDYFEPTTKFEETRLGDAKEQLQALLSSCKISVEKSEEVFVKLKTSIK